MSPLRGSLVARARTVRKPNAADLDLGLGIRNNWYTILLGHPQVTGGRPITIYSRYSTNTVLPNQSFFTFEVVPRTVFN